MRRVHKNKQSNILAEKLVYISGNTKNNRKIADILLLEQKRFCAYTDEYLSRTDAADIEHFNPTLKDGQNDSYNNWFLVKHKWNSEKAYKWVQFQPVLHPTSDDFEERVIYLDGDYIAAAASDIEANNLVKLLQLDDPILAANRKKYIARKRLEMQAFQQDHDPASFFELLLSSNPCQVSYPRAIKEEFGINLLDLLD